MGENKSLKALRTILFILLLASFTVANLYKLDDVQKIYLSRMIKSIGNGTSISQADLGHFFKSQSVKWNVNGSVASACTPNGGTIDEQCLLSRCLSPEDVYTLSGLSLNITENNLSVLSSILLNLLSNHDCDSATTETGQEHLSPHDPPSSLEAWGIGILSTTIINLCSLTGVIALPFIHKNIYKKMLIYMVGLAVGTLTGSSVLFLIPEALLLTDQELNKESYVWKCSTVLLGIYVFFIIERVLKIIMETREARKYSKIKNKKDVENKDQAIRFSSFHKSQPVPDYKDVSDLPPMSPCGNNDSSNSSVSEDIDVPYIGGSGETAGMAMANGELMPKVHSHSHSHSRKQIAPVAWMIIFGDGVHNFIDGVSIGAAFTDSILAGVSVSIAILCEELPHELGDFAVLLNAGMKIKKAVFYNFLSATMCYLGLIVGVLLGENTSMHTWVFAFAGGMFLYISLVDMMPEMNSAGENEDNLKTIGKHQIFLLQNLGLLTGFGIMLLMAIYGGHLEEAVQGL